MANIKISIVVPVYNVAHVLGRCLEYLVHNTYKNLEIIIVDDGSTDDSANVYSQYKRQDKRIKVIKQKNSGPANARNAGIKAASGDYIHFCDADDYVDLDYYQRMVDAIGITEADVICGNVREKGFVFPEFHEVRIFSSLYDKISVTRAYDFNVVWRFVYKRKFLIDNKILFPSGMFWGEDARFMMYAMWYSKTLATACDAVYNCIDNPTSLGKNIKDILKKKKNGTSAGDLEYEKFLADTGVSDVMDAARKKPKITSVRVLEFLRLPVMSVTDFDNSSRKWSLFGIPVLLKKLTPTKTRYYFFGLYLWRIYTKIR